MPDTVPNSVLSYSWRVQNLRCSDGQVSAQAGEWPASEVPWLLVPCCCCKNVGLRLPDLPFSQERQEIHVFMDISWFLNRYRPNKSLWLLHYTLRPVWSSQHPYEIGIIICTCPLPTQLISYKSRVLPRVCLTPHTAVLMCSFLSPLDAWDGCWGWFGQESSVWLKPGP